jgi:hypothetical protein
MTVLPREHAQRACTRKRTREKLNGEDLADCFTSALIHGSDRLLFRAKAW